MDLRHVMLETLGQLLVADDRLDHALEPFTALLVDGLVRRAVDRELLGYAAGAVHGGDGAGAEFELYATPELRIRAAVRPVDAPPPTHLATLTRHTLLGNGGRSAFAVERYRRPPTERNDVFDPQVRLERLADTVLRPGEALALRGGIDAYEIVPLERTAIPVVAAGAPVVPLAWWHDRERLQPVRAKPVAKSWLRLREVLRFAEAIADPAVLPALRVLDEHPSHFIRWSSASLALRLDREAGRLAMRSLVDDPHPQLRAAARRLAEAG